MFTFLTEDGKIKYSETNRNKRSLKYFLSREANTIRNESNYFQVRNKHNATGGHRIITFNFLSSTSRWPSSEMGYQQRVKTRDALLRRILDAATRAKDKMRATRSTHRRARMCAEAEGGNFEHLL
jgi:hypothetical protein